jgi:hypothetical protein
MSTMRHERDDRESARARPHALPDSGTQHPILDLQRQAGNAAVAGVLSAQRHSLSPEDEAGE